MSKTGMTSISNKSIDHINATTNRPILFINKVSMLRSTVV
jgi:hypothetical protein